MTDELASAKLCNMPVASRISTKSAGPCTREEGHLGRHRSTPFCDQRTRHGDPCARKLGHAGEHRSTTRVAAENEKKVHRRRDDLDRHLNYGRSRREYWGQILDYWKTSNGCELCGFESERPGYFDLDHVDPAAKTLTLSAMCAALNPRNPEHVAQFIEEVQKTRVLCVACHREHTKQQHRERSNSRRSAA